ncbi:hypothetical protein THAOC_28793, partial [Thalassiosira oceanica]
ALDQGVAKVIRGACGTNHKTQRRPTEPKTRRRGRALQTEDFQQAETANPVPPSSRTPITGVPIQRFGQRSRTRDVGSLGRNLDWKRSGDRCAMVAMVSANALIFLLPDRGGFGSRPRIPPLGNGGAPPLHGSPAAQPGTTALGRRAAATGRGVRRRRSKPSGWPSTFSSSIRRESADLAERGAAAVGFGRETRLSGSR